ncbi:hypothetical protein [Tautonia sociabilis]|uniref:DUF1795 domain-containing protein n=1 Tax=Tautonia sociabilis TaxID=2080755 RepID=A0A432MJI8_9BACT|nr:hypothetical protein [Tautonia sociabilis]RUL87572.1 hypothetical protein TsocGM_11215 [Tautonia sociabilis]
MNRSIRRSIAVIGLSLALAPVVAAQETKTEQETQKVEAGGLTFQVPSSWKVNRPTNQMRLVEIEVPPAEGDDKPGELVLFAFPGGAGTVQANVQRWRAQFVDEQGRNPEVETETIKANGAEITLVETAGRYVTQIPRPVDEPGFRLLGGIYPTRQVGYFFKLVGPDATITAARPAFKAMLESMTTSR